MAPTISTSSGLSRCRRRSYDASLSSIRRACKLARSKRYGRGYDFLEVIKWWAQHSDRVLILFDPNKLDISDEFREVIEELKVHAGKVRVVLNKADEVEPQKLMRVYGALMWSLGSIVASPEVPRVYIGSFWDAPFREGGMSALMEAEEADSRARAGDAARGQRDE